MRVLLAICMIVVASFGWAAEETPPRGIVVEGKVLEVKNVNDFTYLRLKTADGERWAAVLRAEVKKGDSVTLENATVVASFESKSLKRTFKNILFGNLRGAADGAPKSSALGASFSINPGKKPEPVATQAIAKAVGANAMTVEEIVAGAAGLKGKPVLVRGQVVKYNAEIMGKNWVHLRDGTGSAANGSDDILVTTTDKASVGDVVTAKGVVNVDQDFGAGYVYKVLVEEATLQ